MWATDYFNYQLANGNWVAETKSGKYILMSEESYYDPLAVVMRQSDTKGVLDWTLKYPEQHSYSAPSYYFFPRHFSETKDGGFIVTGGKSAG
ncbi:MAG: hypothetical protein IT235_07025, partial [Bacteroidia bacterium]|nr:hypothetical protein [Bacteroidia bacterium]